MIKINLKEIDINKKNNNNKNYDKKEKKDFNIYNFIKI